jgi:GLPGLI family protein
MKKTLSLVCLIAICLTAIAKNPPKATEENDKNDKRPVFSGIISFYGKVTRIPDKSKTKAKLGDFDSLFKLYLNANFSKRVENYEGLSITITEGINQDIYYQTISSKQGNMLIEATPQEQKDYQLTAKTVRYSSIKTREVTGKKKVNGYACKKVICDMVTEDNIRVQLIAWYSPDLYIPGYVVPFFPDLKGLPLIYDYYNGEHVVTYNATDIKKQDISNNTFSKPSGVEPMTMTQYLRKMQEPAAEGSQE